jgi:hypothetical protein
MEMFDWLLCYMTRACYEKQDKSIKAGKDAFQAKNENQVFFSKTLSIIFIEVFVLS